MLSFCAPIPTVTPALVCSMKVERRTSTFRDPPAIRNPIAPPVIWMPSMISPLTFEITLPVPTRHFPCVAQRKVSTPLERLLMFSFGYVPAASSRILQPEPLVAEANVAGLTLTTGPHSRIGEPAASALGLKITGSAA